MEGAAASGAPAIRAQKAKEAGCNVLLICNNRQAAQEIVDTVRLHQWSLLSLESMQAQGHLKDNLYQNPAWHSHQKVASQLIQ